QKHDGPRTPGSERSLPLVDERIGAGLLRPKTIHDAEADGEEALSRGLCGKTTWETASSSTSTAAPCFRAEISGFEPCGTPQIQQVYGAMDPLMAYTLAPMHQSAFDISGDSGKTTWETTSSSTSTAAPCFRAENFRGF
ncbi:hypothetical protein THAOC_25880, partial [Thalassiosira oceanica]